MKFKFQNKEDYMSQRQGLIDNATALVNDGKLDEAKAVKDDINLMDTEYETYAQAMADIEALNNKVSVRDLSNIKTQNVSGQVAGNIGNVSDDNFTNSVEYRTAFMNNVMRGSAMPKFQNADQNTLTTDVGTVIPEVLVSKIIAKAETVGQIYAKVTKTHYKGGVTIPTQNVKPVASWVAEGKGSDKQKTTTGSITFTWHKLRCAISMSLETETMTLDIFESTFVAQVSEAMIKAIEEAIFNGNGTSQPKGILKETPGAGKALSVANGSKIDYEFLLKCEAAVDEEYDNGSEWYMSKKTFYEDVLSITDQAGQPIARVNVGINGKPEQTILGRKVNFTNYLPKFESNPSASKVFGFIFNMSDYVLNENLAITVKQYEDNDTDDKITKAVMLTDGKCIQTYSLVTASCTKA